MKQQQPLDPNDFIQPISLTTTSEHPMGADLNVSVHSATWAATLANSGQYRIDDAAPSPQVKQ
jgi:hypothetical protein